MATRYGLTGTVAAAGAAILAVLIALSPSERAQSLGLTQHGQTITVQDAGAADAVALVAVAPGTPGQVYTISDAGLPHWAAASGGSPWGSTVVDPGTGGDWAETEATDTSATWAASVLTLSALSGATGRVEVAHAAVVDETAVQREWLVRLDVTAGNASGSTGYFLMIVRADATNYVYLRMTAAGDLRLTYAIAGAETHSSDVAGPSAGQRTGGQLWLRLATDGLGRWISLWGVGSAGAVPTVWTRLHDVSASGLIPAVPATAGIGLWVGSAGGVSLSATHTVDVLAIRSSWRGTL